MSQNVLEEAANIISGDRHDTYGDAGDEFINVAKVWTIYLSGRKDTTISAQDFVNMMLLLKVMRARHGYHRDSYVDICGYAALAERHAEKIAEAEAPDVTWSPNQSVSIVVGGQNTVLDAIWGRDMSQWTLPNSRFGGLVNLGDIYADMITDKSGIQGPTGAVDSGLLGVITTAPPITSADRLSGDLRDSQWQSETTNLIYSFDGGKWWFRSPTNPDEDPWRESEYANLDNDIPEIMGPFVLYGE